jgi:hypothetical protein
VGIFTVKPKEKSMQTHEELTEQEFDVFWDLLGGEPAPANANPNLVREANAFRGGLLAALQTPPPKRVVVKLGQWLEGQFTEAIAAGWQTLEEIFRKPIRAATRDDHEVIERSKRINLGVVQTMAVVMELEKLENQYVKVTLRVLPLEEKTYLPENLKLTLLSESGQSLDKVLVGKNEDRAKQVIKGSSGDRFSFEMALENVAVTENFEI